MTNVTPQERADVRKDAERLCWRWLDILDEELQTNQMTKAAALTAASLLASNVIRRCAEQGDEDNLTQMFDVSDRFFLKPLLRAVTFPHEAYVLALSAGPANVCPLPALRSTRNQVTASSALTLISTAPPMGTVRSRAISITRLPTSGECRRRPLRATRARPPA